jgi:hypothetical protein
MMLLEAILPFNARNVSQLPVVIYTGAQYEFGVDAVSGEMWTAVPGVFPSGPNRIQGCPEVIRFDALRLRFPQPRQSTRLVQHPPLA